MTNAQTHLPDTHADSLYHLGMHYFKSSFTLPDIPKAKFYLLAAAKEGYVPAMEWLGELYTNDSLVETSIDSALYWLNAATAAGDAHAWYKLGRIYERGMNHIEQDFVKSAGCFYKGMYLGDGNCKNGIAYYLYKGFSHRQNYDSAFILFRELALHNKFPDAMYYLGLCHRNGYGIERNTDSAKYWLMQAVDLNDHEARKELLVKTPENPVLPLVAPVKILHLNQNLSSQRMKHNRIFQPLEGVYTGYTIRYDWSGKYIISILPLQIVVKKKGKDFGGVWTEEGDSVDFEAVCTDNNVIVNNTRQDTHLPSGTSRSHWQFKDAGLQMQQTQDSIYITGKIQRYLPVRKEPGNPLYIYVSRTITPADKNMNQ
jgi:TPR repeat protein